MLIQFQEYLTFNNIYLWINFGIIPFWIMLILIPDSSFTKIIINSIILPLILSAAYIYVGYQLILMEESFFEVFTLYLSLEALYTIFATDSFLLIFWIHFVSINLFLGSWVSRDSVKYNMSRSVAALPLFIIYFTGPLGIVLYWIIRVFYSKKLSFHD
jgi:hypothetical protein